MCTECGCVDGGDGSWRIERIEETISPQLP